MQNIKHLQNQLKLKLALHIQKQENERKQKQAESDSITWCNTFAAKKQDIIDVITIKDKILFVLVGLGLALIVTAFISTLF